MLALLKNTVDRCLFTAAFIIGVQLPAFIYAYSQRLAGHYEEAKANLAMYEQLAQAHFNGDITKLIETYQQSDVAAINETGHIVQQLVERVDYLYSLISQITVPDYITQAQHLALYSDKSIAQQTLADFKMSIPLTMESLVTGACFAVLISILFYLFNTLIGKIFRRNHSQENMDMSHE